MIELLGNLLAHQRARGRTPAGDPVSGELIEDGEAEGLLADLAASWSEPAGGRPAPADTDDEVTRQADEAAARGAFLPLRHAFQAFELAPQEYDALLLALAVELDPRFGRLVAYLNDHAAHTRPTVGIAFSLRPPPAAVAVVPADLPGRPFLRDGLLNLDGEDGPLPGRSLRLDPEMVARLAGDDGAAVDEEGITLYPPEPGLLGRLVLADATRDKVEAWAGSWRRGDAVSPALVLAGDAGSGRTTLARAAAAELGLPLAAAALAGTGAEVRSRRLRAVRREARWFGAALLLELDQDRLGAADWEAVRAGLEGVPMPILVEVAPREAPAAASGSWETAAPLTLEEPGRELRARLWRDLVPRGHELADGDFAELAARFSFTPGLVRRALQRARADLALLPAGERRLTLPRLLAACRATGASGMSELARELPLCFTFDDLVVPDELRRELELAVAWVRHQAQVLDGWGLGRRMPFGHGLTALFSGPSGTGKTMAAQVLARELGLDLYRIDLSQVMSKYIGETERNLARLFDQAHASGAILFFDEADAIFGKRSEVKDAHDRYANVEIGYLLQRLEQHDGVTVLATNRRQDMDEAFQRRFHAILHFPMPSAADRRRIWEGMLPPSVPRDPDLDLAPLAERFEISGGEIRNCVLAAAFLAAEEGAPIAGRHLRHAVRRELRKAGRFVDARELEGLE